MYTVEFNHSTTTIISMDDNAEFNDIEMTLADNGSVFLAQYDDEAGSSDMIMISHQQLMDVVASMDSTEGLFRLEIRRD
jgi:hypothetical protein